MSTNVVNDANRPLLTIPEVAQMLGISRERCYQMAADGQIPSVRLSPRRIRVPRAALDAWLGEQTERAQASVREAPSDDNDPVAAAPGRVENRSGGERRGAG